MELPANKTIIEPFRIKMVEPLPRTSLKERREILAESHYNIFGIPAQFVTFDLLTDSGTSAMSAKQWSQMLIGDESYAGSVSYFRFRDVVSDLTACKHVIPTHQGRAAEALLCKALLKPGKMVIGNTHFDTTRANIESNVCEAVDLPCKESADSQLDFPFKGNIDIEALQDLLAKKHDAVSFIIMTVTNNSIGGQPVSLENLKMASALAKKHNIPFFIDAARFAENAFFIKKREAAYSQKSIKAIATEIFSLADGVLMSSKKDAFANIGGFLALNNDGLAELIRSLMVITEGFPTYGGLAGRDLEALAVGLVEILEEDYLEYRIRSVEYFGKGIENAGFKVVRPFGGHAVYIDAMKSLPHIPQLQYPAQSLSVALFEHIGIRAVEVGSVMLGRREENGEEKCAPHELVRLAIPRRVYTQSHVDYMVESLGYMAPMIGELRGYRIDYQPKFLRHFTAKFSQL